MLVIIASVFIITMFLFYLSYIPLILGYITGIVYLMFGLIDTYIVHVQQFTYFARGGLVFIFLFKFAMRFIMANAND
jgi:hypothetical protein